MNTPPSTPEDLQADALIAEIRQRTAAEVARIDAEAARACSAARLRARERARRQQRRAVAELRASGQQQVQRVQAELETAARRHDAAEARAWLAAVEPLLHPALADRWRDAPTRQRWIDAALALARSRLGPAPWTLHHPPDAGAALVAALADAAAAAGRDGHTLCPDPTVTEGLVIEADGARLDARADALLADRGTVQATVLAHLPAGAGR